MLTLKKNNNYQIAADGGKPIYFDRRQGVPDLPDVPLFSLVDEEWFSKLIRKNRLKPPDVLLLKQFYEDSKNMEIQINPLNYQLRSAFDKLEQHLMDRLRKLYLAPEGNSVLPYFTHDDSNLGIVSIGATRSGKTYFLGSFLMEPRFHSRDVYIFTCNPSDASIQRVVSARPKKRTHLINLDKFTFQLKLAHFEKSAIIMIDDCLDVLQDDDDLKQATWIRSLIKETLMKGRHHKKGKDGAGTEIWLAAHNFAPGRIGRFIFQEAHNFIVHPRSNRHMILTWANKKLRFPTELVRRAFAMLDSRHTDFPFLVFRTMVPQAIIGNNFVLLV